MKKIVKILKFFFSFPIKTLFIWIINRCVFLNILYEPNKVLGLQIHQAALIKCGKLYSFPAKQNTIHVMVKTKHKYQYDERNPILDTTNFPIGSLVLHYPKKQKAREKRPFFSLTQHCFLFQQTHTHSLLI